MIDIRRKQHSFGNGFIRETVDELWEDWMRHADAILTDEELLETIHHALLQRRPRSRIDQAGVVKMSKSNHITTGDLLDDFGSQGRKHRR